MKRDRSLDFLRGSAVFLMIITHVNGVFYSGQSSLMEFFTRWGATLCFTVFLFVSGSVYGIKFRTGKPKTNKLLRRAGHFLLVYYLLTLPLTVLRHGFIYGMGDLTDLILLRNIPEFTEFILPFSFFALIMALAGKGIKKIMRSPCSTIALAVAAHILSNFLHGLDWGTGYVNVLKGLLVGHDSWHRFGVLSYLPIFALGLIWGGRFSSETGKARSNALVGLTISAALLILLKVSGASVWARWPPSASFLLYGIAYSLAIIYLFDPISRCKWFVEAVSYLGVNAFKFYVYHLLVLFLIGRLVGWRKFSELSAVLLSALVLAVSGGLVHGKRFVDNRPKAPV